jgi:23S rRNA-/tRNA-specific pseudouridylate synthase
MPLVGDRKYGGAADEGEGDNSSAAYPLCLCAAKLCFTHPASKKGMTFCIEPSWLPLFSKDANMSIE